MNYKSDAINAQELIFILMQNYLMTVDAIWHDLVLFKHNQTRRKVLLCELFHLGFDFYIVGRSMAPTKHSSTQIRAIS